MLSIVYAKRRIEDQYAESGVDLIKLFWRKFTHTFLQARPFDNLSNICCKTMKGLSLQKRVSKIMIKKFYEIDLSWSC